MKRFFVLIIVFVSFHACKPGIPKDIIQPDQMQKVLIDVHLVEGYMANMVVADSAKKVSAAYFKGIHKKFDIDSALYNKSLDYYYKHPILMKKMYDSITVKLTKLKDENALVLVDHPNTYFKGIFIQNPVDSIFLDHNLNLKYNARVLKQHVFSSLTNPPKLDVLIPPTTQPNLPTQVKPSEQPATIAEPNLLPKPH